MWDDLALGAIGAVVLVDTRRLADAFPSIDFFEHRKLPYIVAINCFDRLLHHQVEDVRHALTISPSVPIMACDARDRESVKQVLISVVQHAIAREMAVQVG
jgi:hypothetical protein